MLLRLVSSLLIIAIFTGCASRTVYFMSTPPGAIVSAGSPLCTTPCEASLPDKAQKVLFTLPSGESKEVDITNFNKGADTRYNLAKTGEYVFGTLAFPLLIAAGSVALVTGMLFESDVIETRHSSRDEDISLTCQWRRLPGQV